VRDTYHTKYHQQAAMRAVGCFLRHWRGRGHRYLPNTHTCDL
jgi:hypothetical protein